jgi:hypothetical protein
MTDTNIEEVYAQLNIARILVAVLETLGEISIPVEKIINAENEDKEVQVDYNDSDQTFTFKLKIKD